MSPDAPETSIVLFDLPRGLGVDQYRSMLAVLGIAMGTVRRRIPPSHLEIATVDIDTVIAALGDTTHV